VFYYSVIVNKDILPSKLALEL